MIKWVPSRAGLCLLFLLLGLVVLVFDRYTYKHHSGGEIVFKGGATPAAVPTAAPAVIKELNSKLVKSEVGAGRYAVVVDKNLFAADRTAWQPPAPPQPPAENKEEDSPAPEVAAPVRRDVVLYGTYLSGSVKKAMLNFKRFRQGKVLLGEGEQAKDEADGDSARRQTPVYTLLKVQAKSVTLKDERGGEFSVSLYDNKQRRPVQTDNQKNIQVEAAVTVAPVPVATPENPASPPGKEGDAPSVALSAKDIRKLSVEEKDALVAKGELKKHSTPFGPVYKRAR
ncbi:MAG: hypothetical protein JXR80_00880 [Deltaproteobacteria bacterium]|nr:hypothetical protein [Deltaproteobacteria bacterium]